METKEGNLFESNAIAYYVSNDQLRGKNVLEQSQVIQWLSFADNEVVPAVSSWVFPVVGIVNFNKQVSSFDYQNFIVKFYFHFQSVERGKEDTKKLLSLLNDYLQTRTYLVGERITLADIVLSTSLLPLYQYVNAFIRIN